MMPGATSLQMMEWRHHSLTTRLWPHPPHPPSSLPLTQPLSDRQIKTDIFKFSSISFQCHLIFHNSAEKVKILQPRREMKLLTEAQTFLMHPVLFSYLLQWSFPIFASVLPHEAGRFRRCCKSFGNNEAAHTHSCWLFCIFVCVRVCVCIRLNLNWFIWAVYQAWLRSPTATICAQFNLIL